MVTLTKQKMKPPRNWVDAPVFVPVSDWLIPLLSGSPLQLFIGLGFVPSFSLDPMTSPSQKALRASYFAPLRLLVLGWVKVTPPSSPVRPSGAGVAVVLVSVSFRWVITCSKLSLWSIPFGIIGRLLFLNMYRKKKFPSSLCHRMNNIILSHISIPKSIRPSFLSTY